MCPVKAGVRAGAAVLIEYDTSASPWRQIDYAAIFEIGSRGVVWGKSL